MVVTGLGLAALPKKAVGKILAFEYVDFNEFPPAKGKNRSVPQTLEGQVVVVQAVDLVQTKKLILDLETWIQCFSLFAATLLPHHPGRLAELMAYQSIIAKASARYKWPSWIIYDQSFQQDVESNPSQSWAKVEPSTYALCFTGQAKSAENWRYRCQSLDHVSSNCPQKPRPKRPWAAAFGQSQLAGGESMQYPRTVVGQSPIWGESGKFPRSDLNMVC